MASALASAFVLSRVCLLAPDPADFFFLQEQGLYVPQLGKKCPLMLERLSETDGSLPAHDSMHADKTAQ